MNRGTRIRAAVLGVALVLAILAIFQVIKLGLIGKIAISVFLVLASLGSYYFNNDFSEADCIGTGATRQIKREQKPGYIGERFYTAVSEDMRMEVKDE